MLIGLTFDLRSAYLAEGYGEIETAEFDRDDTVDGIEHALLELGHQTVRIGHVRQLVNRLAAGERWELVFNICEGLYGTARESQVPALLDAYDIPYTFSDAGVMALSLNKAWTKAVLGDAVPTPHYEVVESASAIEASALSMPLFVKPLLEGTGKGVGPESVVRSKRDLQNQCRQLLQEFNQPVLVETYLPGREFTVGLLGTGDAARVLGTFEIILLDTAEANAYGYVNKEECEERIRYQLVDGANDPVVLQAERHALTAWRKLGCRDGGRVDLRCDVDGVPNFIEVNPLAGLNPVHSDLPMLATAVGVTFVGLVGQIVDSAAERVAAAAPAIAAPVSSTQPVARVA